ncbi:hypothetical protein O4G20_07140 [Akkermansia muciniphila]|nr:hypothetical protein [Akkermansia muciniphila]WMB21316.1 hypothetical protein O4G20_07140 [Akkermansia muciniphila]
MASRTFSRQAGKSFGAISGENSHAGRSFSSMVWTMPREETCRWSLRDE